MIKGDWDVLFPAKLSTYRDSTDDLRYEYEVAHLTCFIGGMYGLGGKLFDRPQDIETAKKLTNGCVWAYQSTLSGIMPESGHVIPCSSKDQCEFNSTRWWEELDPSKGWRDERVEKWKAEQETKKADQTSMLDALTEGDGFGASHSSTEDATSRQDDNSLGDKRRVIDKRAAVPEQRKNGQESSGDQDDYDGSELPPSMRQKVGKGFDGRNIKFKSGKGAKLDASKDSLANDDAKEVTENDAQEPVSSKRKAALVSKSDTSASDRPQSHEEFVEERIRKEKLPPGFVDVPSKSYILR